MAGHGTREFLRPIFLSPPATFDRKSPGSKFLHQDIPVISLDFNIPLLDSSSGSAFLLELFGQSFQLCIPKGHAAYDSYSLTLSALGFPADAYNSVSGDRALLLGTDTPIHRLTTPRTQRTLFRGIHGCCIFLLHIFFPYGMYPCLLHIRSRQNGSETIFLTSHKKQVCFPARTVRALSITALFSRHNFNV